MFGVHRSAVTRGFSSAGSSRRCGWAVSRVPTCFTRPTPPRMVACPVLLTAGVGRFVVRRQSSNPNSALSFA